MAQVPATRTNTGGRMAALSEHPLERLRHDFDTLFGRLVGGWVSPFDKDSASIRMWNFDVTENDREIVVRAEMPGFEENELDLQINDDVLTIKAEKQQKSDGHEEYRTFYRAVALPAGVDADKVQANYHNGVLELHIPRAAGTQPRRIKVQGQPANGAGNAPQQSNPAQGNGGAAQQGGKTDQPAAATEQSKK